MNWQRRYLRDKPMDIAVDWEIAIEEKLLMSLGNVLPASLVLGDINLYLEVVRILTSQEKSPEQRATNLVNYFIYLNELTTTYILKQKLGGKSNGE